MKFLEEKTSDDTFIKDVMETRGIEDVWGFSHIDELETPCTNIGEIDTEQLSKAMEFTNWAKDNSSIKVGVFVDSDADGYASSAMIMGYFKDNLNIDVTPIVPPEKLHGIEQGYELIKDFRTKFDLLIVPDSSVNDISVLLELSKDTKIIVIDHHIIEDESNPVYNSENISIISNQWKDSTINKEFTGVGMTMLYLMAIDSIILYGEDNWFDQIPLIALGQIADASDISDLEVRSLVLLGLKTMHQDDVHVNNHLTKAFFNVLPTSHDLSYTIIPRINAITRIGNAKQREQLLEALAGVYDNTKHTVMKRRKNKKTGKMQQVEVMEDMYQQTKTMMDSVKTKQDNYVKKTVGLLETESCANFTFSEIKPKDNKYPSVTGLIANKFINKYQKPSLILYSNPDNPTELIGSARGFEKVMPDFKAYCEGTDKFNWCQGHENAFGVSIQTLPLLELMRDEKEEKQLEPTYKVDRLYNNYNLGDAYQDISAILDNMGLFGGKVNEPTLGFKEIEFPKTAIRIRGNMFTITVDGVNFVCYNNYDVIQKIKQGFDKSVYCNIYGKASESSWGGPNNYQVVCEDIELVTPKKETPFKNGFLDF